MGILCIRFILNISLNMKEVEEITPLTKLNLRLNFLLTQDYLYCIQCLKVIALLWEYCAPKGKVFPVVSKIQFDTVHLGDSDG